MRRPLFVTAIQNRLDALSVAMGKLDRDQCRKAAEDCRIEAARAISPIDRERWLTLAAQWMELARQAGEKSD